MGDQTVKYVVEEINSAYMSYLVKLKERNKQKQIIHQKSEEILKRERLEQGFQLYFNIINNNGNQRLKHSDTHNNTYRSRSANVSSKQEFSRTKSAPNLPKQRRIRRVWGEFNGLDSSHKTNPITDMTIESLVQSSSDKCLIENIPDSKYYSDQFPYPSTKNMHCKQRKWENDSISEEIVCFDKDESSISDVKQSSTNKVEMIEIFGLQLDVYSNWGDKNWVGLSGLELGDDDLAKIVHFRVTEVFNLNLDGVQTSRVKLFHEENLFKEPFQTSDPKHMCFTSVDNLPLRINIKCFMNSEDRISQDSITLRLWNYSDSKFPEIGIKDCCIKLVSNNQINILFNGVIDQIPSGKLTNTPKLIDCDLANNCFSSTTLFSRENCEVVKRISDRNISKLQDRPEKWSVNNECKNRQYLKKVDPFLNDAIDEFPPSSLPITGHEGVKFHKAQKHSVLEESWDSLKFFNHFHSGRINSGRDHFIKPSISIKETSLSDEISYELNNSTEWVPNGHVDRLQSKIVKSDLTSFQSNMCFSEKNKTDKILCPERSYEPITIPVLPFGYTLTIDIISTWGDIYYVGLTGIDIFTMDGMNVAPFCQIYADPADINILPGYNDDPRVITNLIDGTNWTRDDIHMWLAPFSNGARHLIQIGLPSWTKPLALLRIWNYNKSRVHASRGAREILIYLDSTPIFHGEISKASGLELGEAEDFSETILFCTDDDILERIGKNDDVLKLRNSVSHDVDCMTRHLDERPKTSVQQESKQITDEYSSKLVNSSDLITTLLDNLDLQDEAVFGNLWIEVELLKPWNNNASYIGLTGIQIFNSNMEQAKVKHVTIDGKFIQSEDSVQRLFNKNWDTCNPDDMWCVKFDDLKPPKLRIYVTFDSRSNNLECTGLKIWNYNDSHRDTDYSCKLIRIRDHNSQILTPNSNSDVILLRRGPGHTRFEFGQMILLNKMQSSSSIPNNCSKSEFNERLPNGFVYQLNIFSSWYDQFYVGLDGLELIGFDGSPIKISKNQIFAYPSSVNELNYNPTRSDIRTIDKLVDGINQGPKMNYHCWLAPILPNQINQIFIVFDEPIHAIGLRLWNYTRTPERGVRELAVLVDDRLLFRGYLPKCQRKLYYDENSRSRLIQDILPNCEKQYNEEINHYYVIPLSLDDLKKLEDSEYIIDSSKIRLPKNEVKLINIDSDRSRNVLGTNELSLRFRSNINQTLRPTTCISDQSIMATL